MRFSHPRDIMVIFQKFHKVYSIPLYFPQEQIVGKAFGQYMLHLPQFGTSVPFSLTLDEGTLTLSLSDFPSKTVLERMNDVHSQTTSKEWSKLKDLE